MMDPCERLTCDDLLKHPYFEMFDKMVDSVKDEHSKRGPKRSHGNREKNNSRTTVSLVYRDKFVFQKLLHESSIFHHFILVVFWVLY